MMITSILFFVFSKASSCLPSAELSERKRIFLAHYPSWYIHWYRFKDGNEWKKIKNVQSCCSTYFLTVITRMTSCSIFEIYYKKPEKKKTIMMWSVSRPGLGWQSSQMAPIISDISKLFRICLVSNCFMSRYETFGSLSDMWTCLTRSSAFKV